MKANSNWREGLRPERELILCCARTHLDEAAAGRIRAILRGPLSWSDVMATAFDHHVEPFLYENLRLAGDGLVPAEWLDNMRESTRKTGGMAVLYSSELLRIYEIFEAAGVPLIPYKGPVLSWLAYRNLTLRRFLDLDFFVPQEQMPRAAALLKSAGFRGTSERPEELAGRAGYVPGQYGFYQEASQTQVELHTERTLRYFPVPLDFEKMSRRLVTVEFFGRNVRTFSVEDTLIMLCVHGAKHFWDRLGWLLDVAELIAAQPVDWPLTLRIAAKLKSTRLLLLGLYLAHELMGAPLPGAILEQARQDSNVRWLATKVQTELAGGASPHMGVLPRAAFRYRSRDGTADAIGHMFRLATMPTEGDRRSVRLPKALTPFYALVRPWKLIQQYGIGLRSGPRPDLAGYLPLRPEIVDHMLKFAAVKQGDVLYDLGCGDGRIVVAAAETFGIRGVGVDIDPRRIADANANARKHGIQDRVRFLVADAREIKMSEATVVTMYLTNRGVLRLSDMLKQQLRPGARIVSCDSVIYGWPWDEREIHETAQGDVMTLYLWRIGNPQSKAVDPQTFLRV
jgi:SAM-dependent methyltransferase